MLIGKYDPKKNNVIIGVRKLSGFFDGSYVEANRNNPKEMTGIVGAEGETALTENSDRSGTISIVLHKESESNIYLDALCESRSKFPILIESAGEIVREIITSPEGWIEEKPQPNYDSTAPSRTWLIGVADLKTAHSGI